MYQSIQGISSSIYYSTSPESQLRHGVLEEYQRMQCGTTESSYHKL